MSELHERLGWTYSDLAHLVATLHNAEGCARDTLDRDGVVELLKEARQLVESITDNVVAIEVVTKGGKQS